MKKRAVCTLLAALLALSLMAGCSSRDGAAEPEESEEQSVPEVSEPEVSESEPAEESEPENSEEENEESEDGDSKNENPGGNAPQTAAKPVVVDGLLMQTTLPDYKVGCTDVMVEITNQSQEERLTDDWYSIEQYTEAGWQPLKLPVAFGSGPIWLEPDSSQELQIMLYPDSIDYTAGRYRIVKEVLPAGITGEEVERIQIAAEFVLA